MRAIAIDDFGAQPSLRELPAPRPKPNEILVRLHAAGVNPYDWKVANGVLAGVVPIEFPLILGFDGAGMVEAVGEEVTDYRPGDAVFGLFWAPVLHYGTYANFLVTPPRSGAMTRKPANIDDLHAAAVPMPAMMALVCLDAAQVTTGTTLLIVGATGGIGSYATQLAQQRGAHVIATARPETAAYMTNLGAAETVDYTHGDVTAAARARYPAGIDAVIDLVSDPQHATQIAGVLAPGGSFVSSIGSADVGQLAERGIRGSNPDLTPTTDKIERVAGIVEVGRLQIPVERVYPLEQGTEALDQLQHGHVHGKIVLRIR